MSESGSSVTDYFIFSNDLFALVYDSCELVVAERIDSDHLPVLARVSFPKENRCITDKEKHDYIIEKYI